MTEKNELIKTYTDDLVISNPIGEELSLKKIASSDNEDKTFKEIFFSEASLLIGNIAQGSLQIANQSMTVAQIAKQAPNGLFTATVDPTKLSKFKNGTLTTMVHGGEKKLEHFGFTDISPSTAINPAMVLSAGMQVMSMVSGTYYLKQINSQISQIDEKLDELIQFHHDENIGKLKAARLGLSEIATREIVDITDINAIRNYKKTSQEIQEEYSYRVDRDVHNFVPNNKKNDAKKLENLNFQISIAFEASKLALFAELIELGTRMKIGGQSELIEGLTTQLDNNYKKSLYLNIEFAIQNYHKIIEEKYQKEKMGKKASNKKLEHAVNLVPAFGWGVLGKLAVQGTIALKNNNDMSKLKKKEETRKEILNSFISSASENKKLETIDDTINELIQLPYSEAEILYVIDDNRQRVFIPE